MHYLQFGVLYYAILNTVFKINSYVVERLMASQSPKKTKVTSREVSNGPCRHFSVFDYQIQDLYRPRKILKNPKKIFEKLTKVSSIMKISLSILREDA